MHDIYIVDVNASDVATSLENIRELIRTTGAPSLAFMVTAVPSEQPLEERLEDWVDRFEKLQEGVKDLEVRVGILIQALIGHGDRNRIIGDPPFQPIVGADGTSARESFCPLDAHFQAYTTQLIQTLAQTHPAFFMIDDDFRIEFHAPAHKGCMCPLHLDRLSQKLGKSITRQELLVHFEKDDAALRTIWEELKEESLLELANVIRQAIDSVDVTIPGMLCCVDFETQFAPAIARTLAGKHQPQVRINNAIYLEASHKYFSRSVTRTLRQIYLFSDETIILTEADTCPHNRYSLSAKSHFAHITATLLTGCHGAKYWFPKTDMDGWQDTAPFMHMLAEKQMFVEKVREIRTQAVWVGPMVIGRMSELWRKPWGRQAQLDYPSDDWGWRVFGRMGIAFTLGEGMDGVNFPRTMSGTAPFAYDDAELLDLLAAPLLLDGEAAYYLSERGFGEYLGVSADVSSFPCAVEVMHGMPEFKREREMVSTMIGGGRYLLTTQGSETRVVSSFSTGSPVAYTYVAPALTWFDNRLGGRIAVYGLSLKAPLDWIFYNRKRKIQLIETLTWLTHGELPVFADTDHDVFLLHGRDKNDIKRSYLCLFNLNPDTIDRVSIAYPDQVTHIEKLTLKGKWKTVNFTKEDQRLQCKVNAPTMKPLILKLSTCVNAQG